jgi:hypothetical protein
MKERSDVMDIEKFESALRHKLMRADEIYESQRRRYKRDSDFGYPYPDQERTRRDAFAEILKLFEGIKHIKQLPDKDTPAATGDDE